MTQDEFETGIKIAAQTLITAHQTWVDALADLALRATEAELDEDRCLICITHHLTRLQASIEATQPTTQA